MMRANGIIRTVRTRAGYRYLSSGGSIAPIQLRLPADQVSDRDRNKEDRRVNVFLSRGVSVESSMRPTQRNRASLSIDRHTNVLTLRLVRAIWVTCTDGAVPLAHQ